MILMAKTPNISLRVNRTLVHSDQFISFFVVLPDGLKNLSFILLMTLIQQFEIISHNIMSKDQLAFKWEKSNINKMHKKVEIILKPFFIWNNSMHYK